VPAAPGRTRPRRSTRRPPASGGGASAFRHDACIAPVTVIDDVIYAGEYAHSTEANSETYLESVIPLDSGDPADKPLVAGSTYKTLIAYHETDDERTSARGTADGASAASRLTPSVSSA